MKSPYLPIGEFVILQAVRMTDWMTWYNGLEKPRWTPAPATIGLVWQILYPIILVTFGFVFLQAARRKLPWLVALPFAINLAASRAIFQKRRRGGLR